MLDIICVSKSMKYKIVDFNDVNKLPKYIDGEESTNERDCLVQDFVGLKYKMQHLDR